MQFYSLHIESVFSCIYMRKSKSNQKKIYLYFPFKNIDIIFQTLEVHRDQTRSFYFLTMQKIFVKEEHKEPWNYGIITFPSTAKESRHHYSPKILKKFIKKIHFLEL